MTIESIKSKGAGIALIGAIALASFALAQWPLIQKERSERAHARHRRRNAGRQLHPGRRRIELHGAAPHSANRRSCGSGSCSTA